MLFPVLKSYTNNTIITMPLFGNLAIAIMKYFPFVSWATTAICNLKAGQTDSDDDSLFIIKFQILNVIIWTPSTECSN